MPIYKLDNSTAEKIAAGEVVENPASIVKELVENALDADAKRIKVILKKGGLQEITVIDDGSGIHANELRLAMARHATSKIKGIEDLEYISTLGFRGEALPSIASVSKMSITSRHKNENTGASVYLEGNKEKKFEEVGFPTGTRVTVTDLFYNTPARLKFLKSTSAETAKVSRIIHLLALSRPDVSFSFIKESGTALETSGDGQLINVIIQLYGTNLALELVPLNFQEEDLTLKGYISNPSFSHNSRIYQVFFVNNRYVHNQIIKTALDRSYAGIVTSRKYSAAFLFLSIDPRKIDVNVHPSKTEIRFHQENVVQKFLEQSLRLAFSPHYFIPKIQNSIKLQPGKEGKTLPASAVKEEVEKAKKDIKVKKVIKGNKTDERGNFSKREKGATARTNNNVFPEEVKENATDKHYGLLQGDQIKKTPLVSNLSAELFTGKSFSGSVKGQIFGTYILLEENDDLVIIDQHAAHERILWEKLLESEKNKEHYRQEIIPFPLEVPSFIAEGLKDKIELLQEIGLEMEQFGNNTFIIRAVPFFLKDVFTASKIFSIIEDLLGLAATGREYQKETLLKLSCRAAVKANHLLTAEEINSLLAQLVQCKNPYYCPHGRPVMIKLGKNEIEKYFKRQG